MTELEDRIRGALVGALVGDALAARIDEARDGVPRVGPRAPLAPTDVTASMLSCAQVVVRHGGLDLGGWAEAVSSTGVEPASPDLRIGRPASFDNRAALRQVPLALLHHRDLDAAAQRAREAARLTHAHPIGEDGAVMHAVALAALITASPPLDGAALVHEISTRLRTRRFRELVQSAGALLEVPPADVIRTLGHERDAHRSLPTAFHAFSRHSESFTGPVIFAVGLGGDAHAIGALTGALAGAFHGASAIPFIWASMVDPKGDVSALASRLAELAHSAAA